MWKHHWTLGHDPFSDRNPTFVPTPPHDEALARLVYAIEAGERVADLSAAPGLGKSRVLDEALRHARGPSRRIARVEAPADGLELLSTLAAQLGARVPAGATHALAWRALADAARLCRLQGMGLLLAIDDAHLLADPADRRDLDRLPRLDPHPSARITLVRVGRGPIDPGPAAGSWRLAIRLVPLTRGEADRYLAAKLAAAGRTEPTFTPRAVVRLHALSAGAPRGLDRLAGLALMAGAVRRLEIITPEVVEGVAQECVGGAQAI